MSFHLDFDYMRLQVGLESFAYWVLHAAGKTESVKDKEAWKAWVKQNGCGSFVTTGNHAEFPYLTTRRRGFGIGSGTSPLA